MALKSYTPAQLRAELDRRERGATKIQTKRDRLAKEVAALDKQLASLGWSGRKSSPRAQGRKATVRRRTTRNKATLADSITQSMDKGAIVSPAEAAKLVKANGYKTASKTFGIQVAGTLAKDNRFKRVGRGQYERVK